jgi:hypothetical protein
LSREAYRGGVGRKASDPQSLLSGMEKIRWRGAYADFKSRPHAVCGGTWDSLNASTRIAFSFVSSFTPTPPPPFPPSPAITVHHHHHHPGHHHRHHHHHPRHRRGHNHLRARSSPPPASLPAPAQPSRVQSSPPPPLPLLPHLVTVTASSLHHPPLVSRPTGRPHGTGNSASPAMLGLERGHTVLVLVGGDGGLEGAAGAGEWEAEGGRGARGWGNGVSMLVKGDWKAG